MPLSCAELDAHLARHPLRDRRGLDAAVAVAVAVARRLLRLARARARASRTACRCRRLLLLRRPRAPPRLLGRLLLGLARRPRRVLGLGSSSARSSCGSSSSLAAALGAVAERAIVSPTGSVSPSLATIAEHAVGVGLVGHVGLVGLDLDELLAALDLVPVGLQPLEDRALLHGVGQAGHRDVGHARQRTRKRRRMPVSAKGRASRSAPRARSAAQSTCVGAG